jgi:signal transduction histidine kinase
MSWMRRWSWAVAMIVAIVITVGGLVVLESGRQRIAREYETALDAKTAAGELNALATRLASIVGAARGYLLTREPGEVDTYQQAFVQAHVLAAHIDAYYTRIGDTDASARFARVVGGLDARKHELDSIVALARSGQFDAAQSQARDSAALATGDSQREAINDLLVSEEQRAQSALNASRADQRISTLCVGAVSALNIILFVLLFRNLGTQLGVQSREQERLLHTQSELDRLVRERTRQLEALARHLQNVGEEEKTKLARELHDELGAILTATKIDVASAQRRLSGADSVAAEKLARAQGHLDQGIALKRQIIEDMRPTVLAHFGLVTALRTLAEEAAQRNGWRLSLELPEDDIRLDEALAIALFRVAQEALNNAAKYARASRVGVALSLSQRDEPFEPGQASISLAIDDDGIGIAPADLDRARTHGLLGMRQRVAARGGTLEIGPGPRNNGTRVSVRMPVAMQPPVEAGSASGI